MTPGDAFSAALFITAAVGFFALAVEAVRVHGRITWGSWAFGFLGCVWVVAAGVCVVGR